MTLEFTGPFASSSICKRIASLARQKDVKRKWLDSVTAEQKVPGFPDVLVFNQRLTYDATGQILKQRWQHGTSAIVHYNYQYDATQRLTEWHAGEA